MLGRSPRGTHPPVPISLRIPPPALLAVLYAALILAGAGTLALPIASTGPPLDFSESLFTATSAVTVTGLIVVDTATDLTDFGQAAVAVLIQLGGLGLMTFAAFVLSSLGLGMGLSQQLYLQEDLGQTSVGGLLQLVVVILRVVGVAVVAGAALLAFAFVPDHGWADGLWHALFHSVSAFNNAGFSTFSDSLIGYATEPLVNLVVPLQFIVGGLGFVVLSDVFRLRRWRRFSLHTKLMLVGTAALIAVATVVITALEWGNPATLGQHESAVDRLIVGWFQAVTPRTAGFNSLDTGAMTDASTLFTIALMIIGGGSTSTAGGIKVTTFIVMMIAIGAFFRRQTELNAFGHAIHLDQVLKVLALATLSLVLIVAALFVLLATQQSDFRSLLFEAASAFGTVGLSQGATGELDHLGRLVICFLMFAGRVGPLTLGFFLATRVPPRVRYPASPIYLG